MVQEESKGTIKKTVVVHPIMDSYIRKTWSILIEEGYDATYSMALNYMLLIAIMEASRKGGLSERTREIIQGFVSDQKTIDQLNLQEHLSNLKKSWGLEH
jgi:hypothetical protein